MSDLPPEGSVERPFRENPPRWLREVHWSGGKFVSGASRYDDIDAAIRYIAPPGMMRWDNLGIGAFVEGEVFGAARSSTAYVLVGAAYSASTNAYGVIMRSRDGRTWDHVYTGRLPTDSPTSQGGSVFGVVWDGAKFWAGAHESHAAERDVRGPYEIDILLSSEDDGRSWTEVQSTEIDIEQWGEPYVGLLAEHCSDQVKDRREQSVPDGVYGVKQIRVEGEDELQDLVIRPVNLPSINYLFGEVSFGDESDEVLLNGRPVRVGIPVLCVANAGSVWVAGGGLLAEGESAQSAYSTDNGETWVELVTPGISAMIATVIGAPR
jgi:hypothetical protein